MVFGQRLISEQEWTQLSRQEKEVKACMVNREQEEERFRDRLEGGL
jgi:hypothetical protein